MDKFFELRGMAYKTIKVNKAYRFMNSSYCFDDNIIPFLKHDNIVEALKNRIRFSRGGAFLITGLRGVGKSTLVKRAIREISKEKAIDCLPVYINLSRRIKYEEVLFEIIRRLYEVATDLQVLKKVDRTIRNQILLSYKRTFVAIAERNTVNSEISSKALNLDTVSLGSKISMQSTEDITFLTYSAYDIEHDLIRIIDLLNKDKKTNIKLIIVFDELDKLTTNQDGTDYFEDILSKIKTILCSSEVISLFIGDIDLYVKSKSDLSKINSLYSSIFSWHQYVPCIWDSMESLLNILTEREYTNEMIKPEFRFMCKGEYTKIIKAPFKAMFIYINFKSKGIPRNILSQLNYFIFWKGGIPYFQFTPRDIKVIEAYNCLWKKIEPIFYDRTYKTLVERDLKYVVCFNLIDYLFSHAADEEITFEAVRKDLLYDNKVINEKLLSILKDVMEEFVENHIIRVINKDTYVVSDYIIKSEDNITWNDNSVTKNYSQTLDLIKEYVANEQLDFRAKIKAYNSSVIATFWESYKVLKLLKSNLEMDIYWVEKKKDASQYIAIFYSNKYNSLLKNNNCLYKRNRYKIISRYIMNSTDIVIDGCIKTSLVQVCSGYLLSHLIEAKIKEEYFLAIIEQLLEFLVDINQNGFFNANLNANNIIVDNLMNIKVLDVKSLVVAGKGAAIKTKGYAAPELYTDAYDKRCDIYTVGVLLWELVSGKSVTTLNFDTYIDFRFLERPPQCPNLLWEIILKATAFNVNHRYQTPKEMLLDIKSCKKYRDSHNMTEMLATVCTVLDNDVKQKKVKRMDLEHTVLLTADENDYSLAFEEVIQSGKAFLFRKKTQEKILINKAIFEIGKGHKDVDFAVSQNVTISRKHARIITDNNRYYLWDSNSTNGSFVNGQFIQPGESVELKNNDLIRLAEEEFIFKVEDEKGVIKV